jgi:predicted nucleotidyltransferase component of viral defense system
VPEILTSFQRDILKEIGNSELAKFFVWSGGTALSFYYLKHRLSADLDFLSKDLLPGDYLLAEIKKIAKNLKIKKIEEQKRFNRHEFWLRENKEILKIEFVFYPFPSIKPSKKIKEFNLKLDSIEDITTNKTHAIYERAEPKDVFDLYWILKKRKIKFFQIFKWVEKKFGVVIDPVFFISEVLRGIERLEQIKPQVLKKELFKPNLIRDFFQKEAEIYLRKKLKK